jgi:predicted Zn finger-like uncharacterized protein
METKKRTKPHDAGARTYQMRLICPGCGAQYEVADDVIPETGRDVQCSNCNHTWFERPGASVAAEEDAGVAEAPQVTAPAPPVEEPPIPVQEPEETDLPIVAADLDAYDDDGADDPLPPPVASVARSPLRTVTPEIAEILRQEAAREEAARKAESQAGVETQPDLGLDDLIADEVRRAEEARRRLARMRGVPDDTATDDPAEAETAPPVTAAINRRELLPDIEEINSTLRSATERGAVAVQETARVGQSQRRGFRLGYGTILAIAGLLGLTYVFAPRIVAVVPQAEAWLVPYVATIDDGRLWLDLKLQGLLNSIEADTPRQGG